MNPSKDSVFSFSGSAVALSSEYLQNGLPEQFAESAQSILTSVFVGIIVPLILAGIKKLFTKKTKEV